MMKLIRRLAGKAGCSTSYHLAAIYRRDSHVGFSVLSITVDVRPWIHRDNYAELVGYVKKQATGCVGEPAITSLTSEAFAGLSIDRVSINYTVGASKAARKAVGELIVQNERR